MKSFIIRSVIVNFILMAASARAEQPRNNETDVEVDFSPAVYSVKQDTIKDDEKACQTIGDVTRCESLRVSVPLVYTHSDDDDPVTLAQKYSLRSHDGEINQGRSIASPL